MGFKPEHILEAQRRLERNRKVTTDTVESWRGVADGEEIEKLHQPAAKWLRDRGVAFVWNNPSKASTATEGAPDFTVATKEPCFIEFKTKTGKLTAKQQEWHFLARRAGVEVHVLRSMESFLDLMKERDIE